MYRSPQRPLPTANLQRWRLAIGKLDVARSAFVLFAVFVPDIYFASSKDTSIADVHVMSTLSPTLTFCSAFLSSTFEL